MYQFHLKKSFMHQGITLDIVEEKGDRISVARNITFEPIQLGQSLPLSPLAVLDMNTAQQLMDELWDCGVRPTNGHGSTGQLAATERHLNDMRDLVFNKKGK
jgi:hypothetical protein